MCGKQNNSVSFVIVSYNCIDVIGQCIDSILQYGTGEIIVIDNASKDGSVELLQSYGDKIVFVANSENLGYTAACNQGIAMAKGDFIFLLNPDAFLLDNSWQQLVDVMHSDATIGAVTPNLYYPNGDLQIYARRFPTISSLFTEFFVPKRWWGKISAYRAYTYSDADFSKGQELEQPAGAALLFRKDYRLDEHYFIYGSDLELCSRIYKDGKKIQLVPTAKVMHHQSKGGTGKTNIKLRTYLQLDAIYGYKKYFKDYRSLVYSKLFSATMLLGLCVTFFAALFRSREQASAKMQRIAGFIKGFNFRHYKSS